MHIPPFDNRNAAIVGRDDPRVPLCYFNILRLGRGESVISDVPGYETCIVPATGTVEVGIDGEVFGGIGKRRLNVWDGEPEGVYVPLGVAATVVCASDRAEIFVAGARTDRRHQPFAVREGDIDPIQYGSDDTKTHRKIKHILGQKHHGRVGRLLVSCAATGMMLSLSMLLRPPQRAARSPHAPVAGRWIALPLAHRATTAQLRRGHRVPTSSRRHT